MFKDNKKKIIIISIALAVVVCLTIGFAAFQKLLTINSGAFISPGAGTFKVVFSSSATEEKTDPIAPTTYGTATGESATITNGDMPTISNLTASLLNPGDKVEYNFYILNAGKLYAALDEVIFHNAEGKSTFKVCVASSETSMEIVQYACKAIEVTVVIDEQTVAYYRTANKNYTWDSGNNLLIAPGKSLPIKVTLEYTNYSFENQPVIADAPFDIYYGNISLDFVSAVVSTTSTY